MALMIDLHRVMHASGGSSREHRGVVDCCCDDAGTGPPAAQCQSENGSLTCVYAGRGEDDLIRSCPHGGGDHVSRLIHGLRGKASRRWSRTGSPHPACCASSQPWRFGEHGSPDELSKKTEKRDAPRLRNPARGRGFARGRAASEPPKTQPIHR